jgi:mannose-6-phosphate isomerase-like protein (cupin superfamily)
MFKMNRAEVKQREYDGLRSHIFLQQGDLLQTTLAITWVDIAPGSRQMLHRHVPEQVYVIIQGTRRMRVGEEEDVVTGDLIYIPLRSSIAFAAQAPAGCRRNARIGRA